MRSEKLALVRELPLFAAMTPGGFEALVAGAYLQQFPAGTVLIEEGERPDFLHVAVEGTVELYATGAGRHTTIGVVEPVTSFITAAAVQDEPYLMSARAMVPSRILMIPVEGLHHAIATDPAFARAIVLELARGFRVMVRSLKNQKLRTAVERLANYLLVEHERQGGTGAVVLGLEKRTIASLLGIAPENLSRAFNTLKAYGVVVDGARIALNDPAALTALAKPDPLIDGPVDIPAIVDARSEVSHG
ncbi:MAG: cyclic nucleotide-binding domain-containing protein [Azospirillaceae bacterium]